MKLPCSRRGCIITNYKCIIYIFKETEERDEDHTEFFVSIFTTLTKKLRFQFHTGAMQFLTSI